MAKRPRGAQPNWRPTTPRQKGILADLIARFAQHHAEETLPRGPRGIFYDLRPNGMGNGVTYRKPDAQNPIKQFGPMEAHPEAVREVLVLARRAGIIPEAWVADGRATNPMGPLEYDDAGEFARMVARKARNFRLRVQSNQPVFIELLVEAADLVPRIDRIAHEYGVFVYTGSGFDGLKGKREMGERALRRAVPTVILHIGDRDEHGEDIYTAVAEDAVAWAHDRGGVIPLDDAGPDNVGRIGELLQDRYANQPRLVFHRLALATKQADDLGLLDADGKAEVDAVPVPTMDQWVKDAIEALQDPARRGELLADQEQERARLAHAIRDELNKDAIEALQDELNELDAEQKRQRLANEDRDELNDE